MLARPRISTQAEGRWWSAAARWAAAAKASRWEADAGAASGADNPSIESYKASAAALLRVRVGPGVCSQAERDGLEYRVIMSILTQWDPRDLEAYKPRLEPLMSGGGQERGLRSGTLSPALAVGLGKACALAKTRAGDACGIDHSPYGSRSLMRALYQKKRKPDPRAGVALTPYVSADGQIGSGSQRVEDYLITAFAEAEPELQYRQGSLPEPVARQAASEAARTHAAVSTSEGRAAAAADAAPGDTGRVAQARALLRAHPLIPDELAGCRHQWKRAGLQIYMHKPSGGGRRCPGGTHGGELTTNNFAVNLEHTDPFRPCTMTFTCMQSSCGLKRALGVAPPTIPLSAADAARPLQPAMGCPFVL